jgi:hypothetical protein
MGKPPISRICVNGVAGGGRRAASIEALRVAVEGRAEETSLRQTAREIGMSAPGLSLFLNGSSPRPITLEKIRAWHLAAAGPDVPVESARTALHALVCHLLPGDGRVRMIRKILATMAQQHRRQGRPFPPWLARLSEDYGVGLAEP